MTPTATSRGAGDDIATFDPFANVRSFKYSGSVKAVYPLSPKPKIPPSIRRPNYAREGVRMWLEFWWQVRIPLLTIALPVFARPRHADALPWSTLFALLLLGLALDALKQFLESRNIKVNTQADQDGVRKSATVCLSSLHSHLALLHLTLTLPFVLVLSSSLAKYSRSPRRTSSPASPPTRSTRSSLPKQSSATATPVHSATTGIPRACARTLLSP